MRLCKSSTCITLSGWKSALENSGYDTGINIYGNVETVWGLTYTSDGNYQLMVYFNYGDNSYCIITSSQSATPVNYFIQNVYPTLKLGSIATATPTPAPTPSATPVATTAPDYSYIEVNPWNGSTLAISLPIDSTERSSDDESMTYWYSKGEGLLFGFKTLAYYTLDEIKQANVIRKEAFEGDTMIEIVIPESCTKIENRAFANCKNLQKVTILAKDIEIEDDAFAGCDQVILYAVKGSDALAYAFKNGLYYSTI